MAMAKSDVPVASEEEEAAAAPKFVLDTDVATSISFSACLQDTPRISEVHYALVPQPKTLNLQDRPIPPRRRLLRLCVCGGCALRKEGIKEGGGFLMFLALSPSLSLSSSRNKVGLLILAPESKKERSGLAYHCATSFMLTLISFITFVRSQRNGLCLWPSIGSRAGRGSPSAPKRPLRREPPGCTPVGRSPNPSS